MSVRFEIDQEDFRPRLIIWQLQPEEHDRGSHHPFDGEEVTLTSEECCRVLESIARISKPIIVLTGSHLLRRPDLFPIVEFGHALGLKMIVETTPEDITQDLLRQYSLFGPRVFRISLDRCVLEDAETRFQKTPEFYALERCLRLLKTGGFEIHLGVTVQHPTIRALAFEHDYAFRHAARGLYCHLSFDRSKLPRHRQQEYTEDQIEQFIEAIAKMKRYSPENMYFSPQCVQYGFVGVMESSPDDDHPSDQGKQFEWKHLCLGGKRFAYITSGGKVQICSGLNSEAGDLRMTDCDFQEIWESSAMFREQRNNGQTCTSTREHITSAYPVNSNEDSYPVIDYMP